MRRAEKRRTTMQKERFACIVLIGLLVLAPGYAAAADEPEIVYQKFHQAVLGPYDPPGLFPFLSAALREQFDKDTVAALKFVNKIQFMKDEMPRAYKLTGKTPRADGKSLRLTVAGEGRDLFKKPTQMTGTVDLINERSEWKIVELTWGKRTAP
jgi:hypothetical protein